MPVKPIPDGMHTVTPHLAVRDAKRAIEFYKKAFNAEQIKVSLGPEGKVMHAHLKIGDSNIFLNDEFPEMGCVGPETLGNCSSSVHLSVADVDTWFNHAVEAGASVEHAPQDMFWGDRYATVRDPFGHRWSIGTHVEDLTDEEVQKRQAEFFKQFAGARK